MEQTPEQTPKQTQTDHIITGPDATAVYGVQLGARLIRSAADRVHRASIDGLHNGQWTVENLAYVRLHVGVMEAELKTIKALLAAARQAGA